jgi:hypothetical protein
MIVITWFLWFLVWFQSVCTPIAILLWSRTKLDDRLMRVLLLKKRTLPDTFVLIFDTMLLQRRLDTWCPLLRNFLDELAHAQWFSSLDLMAGYHQILL